jgi:hypothetical protein
VLASILAGGRSKRGPFWRTTALLWRSSSVVNAFDVIGCLLARFGSRPTIPPATSGSVSAMHGIKYQHAIVLDCGRLRATGPYLCSADARVAFQKRKPWLTIFSTDPYH